MKNTGMKKKETVKTTVTFDKELDDRLRKFTNRQGDLKRILHEALELWLQKQGDCEQ